jgi:hypothetical protein
VLSAPVFVLGIHKSGTSLLRSLLDGTPELAVLPREPHFFERAGLGVSYPLRPSPPSDLGEEAFLDRVTTALRRELTDGNPYSDSPDFSGYDADVFLSAGWRDGPDTLAGRYERYAEALWWTITHRPLGDQRVVDKSTEYLEFAHLLATLFPDASFVQVVRNPYAVLVSYRSYRLKHTGSYPDLRVVGQALAYSAYWQFRNVATIPAYQLVRYEDLVSRPTESMHQTADALGLPFSACMTTPTLLGRHWEGNSTADGRFTGVSTSRLDSWRTAITDAEIRAVNKALPESLFALLGYEHVPTPARRMTIRRHPRERPVDYVRNRFL